MSIIKHVTLQKIVARDFRYDPHSISVVIIIVVFIMIVMISGSYPVDPPASKTPPIPFQLPFYFCFLLSCIAKPV